MVVTGRTLTHSPSPLSPALSARPRVRRRRRPPPVGAVDPGRAGAAESSRGSMTAAARAR